MSKEQKWHFSKRHSTDRKRRIRRFISYVLSFSNSEAATWGQNSLAFETWWILFDPQTSLFLSDHVSVVSSVATTYLWVISRFVLRIAVMCGMAVASTARNSSYLPRPPYDGNKWTVIWDLIFRTCDLAMAHGFANILIWTGLILQTWMLSSWSGILQTVWLTQADELLALLLVNNLRVLQASDVKVVCDGLCF